MNLLKSVVDVIHDLLVEKNIVEVIDLRISNLDNFDYQINNLVKYQNHPEIELIKTKIGESLNSFELINNFEFAKNLFINIEIKAELRACLAV